MGLFDITIYINARAFGGHLTSENTGCCFKLCFKLQVDALKKFLYIILFYNYKTILE
jgi:hypothetical protein